MKALRFTSSFRVRFLLVLAALLILTLGTQYLLNLRAGRTNRRLREQQEQALIAGVALGVKGLVGKPRLVEVITRENNPLFDSKTGRVANVIIVDNEWFISDSLDLELLKVNGEYAKRRLQEVTTLPAVMNLNQLPEEDRAKFPSTLTDQTSGVSGESHAFAIETADKGRWHVIVVLKSFREAPSFWNAQAARPLVYTLGVLLAATIVAAILVWRFTRPIKDLSNAARRVAEGDFDFRVPAANRSDEMGQLASRFNEMIARLGHLREVEAQLHQAEQSAVVGRLASAIAHEIRNPLNYINLTLDHLRTAFAPEDQKKRETFERLAQQLKIEVARINTRISEFLNYSRPSPLEMRPLDLRAEAEDALRMVEVKAQESGIETRVEQTGEMPPVIGDAEALRSVFTNLIINGMQAIDGAGGKLTIRISSVNSGHNAQIEVTDTGHGIAPEDISKVFEPYFSTKDTGTGLGLAIVKKAVDDHGGTISVKSKQGSGTTFTITLPTSELSDAQKSNR
ncbi:MAG: HAMP domain-containing protein [Acidobacteria bacterium]|nr:HAMP domain-containing protein [Acidobacteriota bacterium]